MIYINADQVNAVEVQNGYINLRFGGISSTLFIDADFTLEEVMEHKDVHLFGDSAFNLHSMLSVLYKEAQDSIIAPS
jgi:hypothetical protein